MNYKPRPGIVKVKLCGMQVLIPTREASAYCKSIQKLSFLWSVTWDAFCRGASIESSVPIHAVLTKKSPEECRKNLELFCKSLAENGFLIEEADDPARR